MDTGGAGQAGRGNAPFHLMTAALFACLTVTRTSQPGMFVDGVTYAAIARNLAQGDGSFWSPFYTATLYPQFFEHPPLGFALQGAVFRVFGDHLFVERAYSVSIGALTALVIALIWRRTVGEKRYDWLPILFWLLPATVSWSIVNNMLETTQALFTTLAILFFVRSLESRTPAAWAALSGFSVIAAILTKGPVGLFPLAAPFIAIGLHPRHATNAIQAGLLMLALLTGAAVVALTWSEPRTALLTYWDRQVLASIGGARAAVGGRWPSLVRHLLLGVVLRMGALLIVLTSSARAPGDRNESRRAHPPGSWMWFFLLLALAASCPVAASARVAGHYLVPSVPFFALFFAAVAVRFAGKALALWHDGSSVRAAVMAVGILLGAVSAIVPLSGRAFERRDARLMTDYARLAPSIPRGGTIGTCAAAAEDFGHHAYMQRWFRVSLDPGSGERHRFFLQLTDRECAAPPMCRVLIATERLVLWECP